MRQLAAMGIQAWQRREVRWPCLKLVAKHEIYIICAQAYQAASHQALWLAITKAMSRWSADVVTLSLHDIQTLSADAVIYYLGDQDDLDTSACLHVMPSLQAMLDDPSQKAILWNAVKNSMSHT